jgi:HD-like signal output (HDOD) protein
MEANKIASAIKSFPGMPGTAVKLLGLIDDPAMRVSQIEEILRHDPGLTANVLRLANSAYFGIPSKVGSIRQAVILLGLKRLIPASAPSWTNRFQAMTCRPVNFGATP